MDGTQNMNEQELMKACMPLLVHPSFMFFNELLRRRQARHIKAVCSLSDPIEIYRSQGKVKAYDDLLNLDVEIKALK
jgi:hypothetical protein